MENQKKEQLLVIWSAADPDVARNMVFMYTKNSKLRSWWNQVHLVIWGPSAKLLATDENLQTEIQEVADAGVKLEACKACADNFGVSEKLSELGIEVIYMGAPLTERLKAGWTVLTF